MNNSTQLLEKKFSKIEEIIENKINEKIARLQMNSLSQHVTREMDEKIQREFSNAFEKTVTPCIEKYLSKVFEQVCNTFEKGQKFYIDKLNIEQAKCAQVKETMSEVVKSFVQISTALTESIMNNQNSFNKMENNFQDKQTQISRLVDQMNEILLKQQDIQKKLESTEKNINDMIQQYNNEIANFQSFTEKYLERIGEQGSVGQLQSPSPRSSQIDSKTEDTKKENITSNAPSTTNPNFYPQNAFLNQNMLTSSMYNASRSTKSGSLADHLPYLQSLATHGGYPNRMPPMMSPSTSQILSSGYGYDSFGNPYHKSRTAGGGMMFNPNYPYQQQFNPDRTMMANYPYDYHLIQQYEMMKRGKEDETASGMPFYPQNQLPHFQPNITPTMPSTANINQTPPIQNNTNQQQQQPVNPNQTTQSLPNLTSQPSFGPQNQTSQTVGPTQQQNFNPNSGNYPYFNPPQMMNAQINKNSVGGRSQNPVDSFYQIPLVSSMVKESSKESQSNQQSNTNTQGTSSPQ